MEYYTVNAHTLYMYIISMYMSCDTVYSGSCVTSEETEITTVLIYNDCLFQLHFLGTDICLQ